jgi:hypothetical protein
LVSFAIFDSNQRGKEVVGVQGVGTASVLDEKDVVEALEWYKTTYIDNKIAAFIGSAPYRFLKIIPTQWYVLDPHADIDKRVEVTLDL